MRILAVIPARGGSKGIPKKNIRMMAGKPLIYYSINNATSSKYDIDVVVSTDSKEIKSISEYFGAQVVDRSDSLANDKTTLDPVIYDALVKMEKNNNCRYDIVVTMQPTSPLLSVSTFDSALEYFFNNSYDTVISAYNSPHLAWTKKNDKIVPAYSERVNRQYLPEHYCETGAFFISARENVNENSRIGKNVSVFCVPENESVDIDTAYDWWVAEKELNKKTILIRTEGYNEIGTGHIFRSLLLGYNLIDHDIHFVISSKSDIGIKKLKESFFKYSIIENEDEIYNLIKETHCDILVNDCLNTTKEYIVNCKNCGVRVVNLEDLGEGSEYADAVINDLYEKQNDNKNFYWGSDYYCIKDEFLYAEPAPFNKQVKEVIVSFGGTDPCNLTNQLIKCAEKVLLIKDIHFTFIIGLGYKYKESIKQYVAEKSLNIDIVTNVSNMADYMSKADIAVCSQGRTMLELACMTVPTIVFAQNERESSHEFGYIKNGFINLGLGKNVDEQTIIETIVWLINSCQIREQIKQHMKEIDLKHGLDKVLKIILGNEGR